MDVSKPWKGGYQDVEYTDWRGNKRRLQMEPGMTADGFTDVEGQPDMVCCNVYLRCMTYTNVIVPRAGFEAPKPKEKKPASAGALTRARDMFGRFMPAR